MIGASIRVTVSIIWWGCMSACGVGSLQFIFGTVSAQPWLYLIFLRYPRIIWSWANTYSSRTEHQPTMQKLLWSLLLDHDITFVERPRSEFCRKPMGNHTKWVAQMPSNNSHRITIQEILDCISLQTCGCNVDCKLNRIHDVLQSKGYVTLYNTIYYLNVSLYSFQWYNKTKLK